MYWGSREREGCINCRDYKALIEYWESFNPIPKVDLIMRMLHGLTNELG